MGRVELANLEALYRERFLHFVRVAAAVVRDDDRALDVVQEAFATAVRGLGSFRGEGPLEAWVWRIVVNQARKASRQPVAVEGLAVVDADGAVGERSSIRAAVARLPERQRLALFLRYYADLDYRSIAAALEISPGTVAASLSAAHASLRRLLQEVH